jgi:hypothetical protein
VLPAHLERIAIEGLTQLMNDACLAPAPRKLADAVLNQ